MGLFRYIKSLTSMDEYDLKTLSYRLAILLRLTAGKRDQTISYMNLALIKFETDMVTIFVPELLKQTCSGHHLELIVLMRYSATDISALSHLEKSRKVTKSIRKFNKLLVSSVKTHKPIFTSTLSRWCVSTLQQAGVDIAVFGSHSTPVSLNLTLPAKGLFIKQINKAAGWPSVQTFARSYRKPIEEEHFSKVISEA